MELVFYTTVLQFIPSSQLGRSIYILSSSCLLYAQVVPLGPVRNDLCIHKNLNLYRSKEAFCYLHLISE